MSTRPRVAVIGSGVIGMLVADELSECASVALVSAAFPGGDTPRTTSEVAAAVWYPFRVGTKGTGQDWREWAAQSHQRFLALTRDPDAGVTIERGMEYLVEGHDSQELEDDLWWRELPGTDVETFAEEDAEEELPRHAGGKRVVAGVGFRIPVIDMPLYLRFLSRKLEAAGVRFVTRRVQRPEELFRDADVVVNCAGVGAAAFEPSDDVIAGIGHAVLLAERGGARMMWAHRGLAEPIYAVPRQHGLVLGGTVIEEPGDRLGVDLPQPDATIGERILERCVELAPELLPIVERNRATLRHTAGARPFRGAGNAKGVRLELVPHDGGKIVAHHYGHGGGGVTLGPGSAAALRERLVDALR